jgi:oligopeptidase A
MPYKLARIAGLILLLIAQPAMSDDNPLFQNIPLLNYQGITAANFEPAMDAVLQQFDTKLAAIVVAPPSWDNTIEPLQEATNAVTRVWNVISHLNSVNGTPEIQAAYQRLLPKVTGFYSKIMYNSDIYNAYKMIAASPEISSLSSEQQAHIRNMLKDFKLSGGDLDTGGIKRYKEINVSLGQLGRKFSLNVTDAIAAWQYEVTDENMLAGVPESIKTAAANKAKAAGKSGWILTLDEPCVAAISSYCNDRALRETIYKAYNTLASDQATNITDHKWNNSALISQIISLRQELATLLGYKNYLEYMLAFKGTQTPDEVLLFLNDLATQAKPKAQQDYNTLQQYARNRDRNIDTLEAWDIPYYSQKYKDAMYVLPAQQIRQYFPKDAVIRGLFTLVNLIYNIEFKAEKSASTWNPAVQVYSITDQNKQLRGYFYLDIFARKDKRNATWMGVYTPRFKFSDGAIQLPVAFINASFPGADDGLLAYTDVLILFREFGHMLEHVLSLGDYPDISGIGAATLDGTEMASRFMQDWFWVYDVMLDVSQHVTNGQDLPRELFEKMFAAHNYNAALILLGQLELSLFDFTIHANLANNIGKDPLAILNSIQQQIAVRPHYDYERTANHFAYGFATGYAANYYVYQWTEVLAADAFAAFKERNLFDPQMGRKFLQTILERTGEETTLDLFRQFRGRDPESKAYLVASGIISK